MHWSSRVWCGRSHEGRQGSRGRLGDADGARHPGRGESYGYAILRRINELSGGELDWTEGLLYPLLHRLERLGYVESSWQSVTGERRRKYYRITNKGLDELAEQRRQWDTIVDALKEVWLGPDLRSYSPAPLGGLA
jgi:PadR family transcriptional regulator